MCKDNKIQSNKYTQTHKTKTTPFTQSTCAHLIKHLENVLVPFNYKQKHNKSFLLYQ